MDDLLANLRRANSANQFASLVACLTILQVPISWKKVFLGDSLVWCGWKFNFRAEVVELQASKLHKLLQQLQSLRESRHASRKDLESCQCGPPASALTFVPSRRLFTPICIVRQALCTACLLASGNNSCSHSTPRSDYQVSPCPEPPNERFVSCKADMPPVPASAAVTWLRVADPKAQKVVLRNDSIHWLMQCLTFCPAVPLRIPHLRASLAAADAMAEGDTIGIGGWFALSDSFAWFCKSGPFLAFPNQGASKVHCLLRDDSSLGLGDAGQETSRHNGSALCHSHRFRQRADGSRRSQVVYHSQTSHKFLSRPTRGGCGSGAPTPPFPPCRLRGLR